MELPLERRPDEARGVMVMFGGNVRRGDISGLVASGETWEWDGVRWTLRDTIAAPSRLSTLAFDPRRGAVVRLTNGELFAWNGATWTNLDIAGGPISAAPIMVHEPATGRLVVISSSTLQAFALSGTTWQSFGTRINQRFLSVEPSSGRVISGNGGEGAIWRLSGTTWELYRGAVEFNSLPLYNTALDVARGTLVSLGTGSGAGLKLSTAVVVR